MSEARRRHTALGDMAHECAQHRGTMIVDIEVQRDGTQQIHAVATWEDAEPAAEPADPQC